MKNQRDDYVKYIPGKIVMKILAILPVQNIMRFKLVCREWKSVTESAFFLILYQSNDWSILHGKNLAVDSCVKKIKHQLPPHDDDDVTLFFVSFFTQNKDIRVVACADGLVLLRLTSDKITCYYIGNLVLSQWIQLPSPSLSPYLPSLEYFIDFGLVTRMHNGALVSYKVIRNLKFSFDIFSSDTGEWSVKEIFDRPDIDVFMTYASNHVSLNGKIFWLDLHDVIVYDFFSHESQTICLPSPRIQGADRRRFHTNDCCKPSPCQKIILTTSQGYCVLADVELINRTEGYNVRIWRFKSDCWKWEMAWEINMSSVGLGSMCVPLAINYFDIHIIYLWDLDRRCFVAYNLQTHSKSYGTRKNDAVALGKFCHKDTAFPKSSRFGYMEFADRSCLGPRLCLSQFVPTLQVVPI